MGAAAIRHIGDVDPAIRPAGEVPHQKRIHVTEQHIACLSALANAGNVFEHPANFETTKISAKREASLLPKAVLAALSRKFRDGIGHPGVLPNDSVVHRFAGLSVPQDGCLSLIRDANSGEIRRLQRTLLERSRNHLLRSAPDFFGIVLHPAGLGVDLLMLALLAGHDATGAIENDETRAGRPLVEGTEITRHVARLSDC